MSLRDIVTGSDNCSASDAGPSNAVGALVNTLLGQSTSKTHDYQQFKEVGGWPGLVGIKSVCRA